MKSWLIQHCPTPLFPYVAKLGYTKIHKIHKDWLITRDNIALLSPTPKFIGFGLTYFTNKFEHYFKINEGDTCLDVGACIGDTTIPMALKTGWKGKVIAIEPHPQNIAYLKRNTKFYPQVEIIQKGVYNEKGLAQLYLDDTPTGHGLHKYPCHDGNILVEIDILDNLLEGRQIDYAKIDAQTSEIQVLEGADNLLRTCPKIVVESHFRNTEERTYPKIIEILESYGFTVGMTKLGIVYGWKDSHEKDLAPLLTIQIGDTEYKPKPEIVSRKYFWELAFNDTQVFWYLKDKWSLTQVEERMRYWIKFDKIHYNIEYVDEVN